MKVAAIIPCYRVKDQILDVLKAIPKDVHKVYVIDDACPDASGDIVRKQCIDERVEVITNSNNLGVGGAVMTGYKAALCAGYDILVKIDGDGQMDPSLASQFIKPIQEGKADYTKGNRFFYLNNLQKMPIVRLIGNSFLSFLTKIVSGYWNIMDPTNGYTAISATALKHLSFDKISPRYFFETDMLFRLNIVRAVVKDIPMQAKYDGEHSSLQIHKVLLSFPSKFLIRFFKRIFYNYFLRDFNFGSLSLVLGTSLFSFGVFFGSYKWYLSSLSGVATPAGTIMVAALPIILGFQLLVFFFQQDIASVPNKPLSV